MYRLDMVSDALCAGGGWDLRCRGIAAAAREYTMNSTKLEAARVLWSLMAGCGGHLSNACLWGKKDDGAGA
jgi:hypothetical protein